MDTDLQYLQTPDPISRPWGFRGVVATAWSAGDKHPEGSSFEVPLPGVIWCHYQTGPDLFVLARVVRSIDPRALWVGLRQTLQPCGFQGRLD